jgi:predicted amidohydrolase
MTAFAIQFDIAWENKEANFKTVSRLLETSRPAPGSLVCLPEMFATGFSMNAPALAEEYGGPTEQFLSGLAQQFRIYILAGAAMRGRDGKPRNKALVFAPEGKLIAYYAKMRPFTPGGEADHYTAGQRITAFEWNGIKVSPFICYDLRFPELFRKAAASHQPEMFVVIASFPEKRLQHWLTLLQARAIENQAYVMGVNRIGSDPYYTYAGHSVIIDPRGQIIADADRGEGCISADLDIENLRKYRAGLPFLNDLKID